MSLGKKQDSTKCGVLLWQQNERIYSTRNENYGAFLLFRSQIFPDIAKEKRLGFLQGVLRKGKEITGQRKQLRDGLPAEAERSRPRNAR